MIETLHSALPAAVNTLLVYVFLIVGIRTLGRRQAGQLTALDLLIVLLLGSAVETAMIGPASSANPSGGSKELFHDPNVTLIAGLVSAGTLLVANRLLGKFIARSKRMRHLIVGGPLILVHDGAFVHENLRRAGMTETDTLHALRVRGYASHTDVCFAVLEPNGEIHALARHTVVRRARHKTVNLDTDGPG